MRGQHECAYVGRRNGAYLIALMGDLTDDATPDELYNAASSLAAAKRLARAGAEAFGYTPTRWHYDVDADGWWLMGAVPS